MAKLINGETETEMREKERKRRKEGEKEREKEKRLTVFSKLLLFTVSLLIKSITCSQVKLASSLFPWALPREC